jgi:hypothetical protein
LVLIFLVAALTGGSIASGQPVGRIAVTEQKIQAAYLYKFANYIEWPDSILSNPAKPPSSA